MYVYPDYQGDGGLGGSLPFDCAFRCMFEVGPGGGGLYSAHAKSDVMLEVNRKNIIG